MMKKLYWSRIREDARIPRKRAEDAGYDLYPCFEQEYIELQPLQTQLIPLGVASSFDQSFVMFLKERGSTGSRGMAVRAGVIDSGYRGEYMAPITNLNKKPLRIIRQSALEKLSEEEKEQFLFYPYEKAICQGVLLQMPDVECEEVSYEKLQEMESQRQQGRLGSTGK